MFDIVFPDGFGFDLPVWITVDAEHFAKVGLPNAYMGIGNERGHLFTFFTDKASAEQFIAEQPGWHGVIPHALKTIGELRQMVEEVGRIGCKEIIIDGRVHPSAKSRGYQREDVLQFLRHLESGRN